MRAERKTPVQPSQICRKKPHPNKRPGARYTSRSYAAAIGDAAKKARVAHWHPNQLRHSYATRVRKEHGLEAAQVLLGHARADVTQIYAERNLDLALTVAAKIG
jgi:site-specific recombinase XerC